MEISKLNEAEISASAALTKLISGPALSDYIDGRINHRLKTPNVYRIEDGVETRQIEGTFHESFETVLTSIQVGHVALVGPTGCGKTTMAEQVAESLGLKFFMTGAIQHEYKLTGFIDANGNYIGTSFRDAYENGGMFLFDEIDACSANVMLAFNAALANGKMDFPDGIIERHKDFKCIAASNTFWGGRDRVYVGRNQLDAATMDRFIFVEMDYDNSLEEQITGNEIWVKRVRSIRELIKEEKIRHVVSPRASIQGALLLEMGMNQSVVENLLVWKGLEKKKVDDLMGKLDNLNVRKFTLDKDKPPRHTLEEMFTR